MFCFLNWSLLLSSRISDLLQDIEKGIHDDDSCENHRRKYKNNFRQDLPDCEYKGNKSKIQKLIRKVQIDESGIVTEIQFDNKKNDDSKSLRTKLKNFFRRKWSKSLMNIFIGFIFPFFSNVQGWIAIWLYDTTCELCVH